MENKEEPPHMKFYRELHSIPDIQLAHEARLIVSRLCHTGGRSFTMTAPAQLTDSDIVLSEVIRRFELSVLSPK